MPPSRTSSSDIGASSKWVDVTWMPHASISHTSHVCLTIRSLHVPPGQSDNLKEQEWMVKAAIKGIGGILLVPVTSQTRVSLMKIDEESDLRHFISLPFRWRDLPRDSFLYFEVVDHKGSVIYETSMSFFNKYGRLCTGLTRLGLCDPRANEILFNSGFNSADVVSKIMEDETQTSWKQHEKDPTLRSIMVADQLQKFQDWLSEGSSTATHKTTSTSDVDDQNVFSSVPSVPWLDVIQRDHCRQVLERTKEMTKERIGYCGAVNTCTPSLIIELPSFNTPVLHEETFYPIARKGGLSPLDLSLHLNRIENPPQPSHPYNLVRFLDYEDEVDNPVGEKYRALAHDLLRGLVDPALKPDRDQRDRLAAIIASPSHHPTREEKDLLWRFRFSLVDNRKALTKFLLAVDWTVESEVVQAAELLEQWRRRSPIEVTDALKLLGKHVAFQTNLVRTYAIDTLAAAPDDELRLYLLQLVQALKYETFSNTSDSKSPVRAESDINQNNSIDLQVSPLAAFLISRAKGNLQLASYLYWYLKVELQDPTHGAKYKEVFLALRDNLSKVQICTMDTNSTDSQATASLKSDKLSSAAIETIPKSRSSGSPFKSIMDSMSKQLGASLQTSSEQQSFRGSTKDDSTSSTKRGGEGRKTFWEILEAQDHFISGLMDIQMRCRDARGKKDAKEAQLRLLLLEEGYDRNGQRDAIPLPSAPHYLVNGVNPKTAKMFKSALYPALVEFHVEQVCRSPKSTTVTEATTSRSKDDHLLHYKVIVKTGDDLRQDQLVIMMVQLMDGLLKRAALDLCLSPYSIIAMSPSSGLVEFVDGSMPISQILSAHNGSILQFFRSCAPQSGAKYGIRPDVVSTYLRSCAGYCVITFLMAVGDRHLDNILLDTNGHFFHIDFGFIFGRDPKPLPPAFRLTREMVEGMGGLDSNEYQKFCSLACQAFNILRKSAGLVLNLFHLMGDAGIEDLSNNPSADVDGVIDKIEERFRLDLTDEQAERYFLGLINDCLSAIAPRVMDVFHSLAVARR